jgi:hypothetical protein
VSAGVRRLEMLEEAKREAEQVQILNPKFSIDTYIESLPVKSPEIVKPYINALNKVPFSEL